MKKNLKYSILAGMILMLGGCEKAIEVYIGLPFQPENINSVYEPGLNVFGILKAGPSFDSLNHYFEVEKLQYISDTTSFNVNDAGITLEQIKSDDSRHFYHLNNYTDGKYTDSTINTDFGETWIYSCAYDSFLVESSTRIPDQPVVKEGSFNITGNTLSLTLLPDTTAFMYEVYYLNTNDYAFNRLIPDHGSETVVELEIKSKAVAGSNFLFVFAYDRNYEKYISTSNVFYKPNAYRPRYTTVEGGWGCFCSVSSVSVTF